MPKYYNKVPFTKQSETYWRELDPILMDGEVVLVSDDVGGVRIKVGNGTSTFTELPFITSGGGNGTGGGSIDNSNFNELIAYVDQLALEVDALSPRIDENANSIAEVSSSVTEVSSAVTEVSGVIDSINVKADSAVSTVNGLYNEVTRLEGVSNESVSHVNAMRDDVSNLRVEVEGFEYAISQNTTDIASVSTIVGTYENTIGELNTSVGTLTTEVGTLSNTVSATTDELKDLRTRVQNIISSGGGGGDGEGGSSFEVIDIRTGYDGTVYETAGDAVRALGLEVQELRNIPINPNDLGLERDENTGLVHPTFKGIRSTNGIPLSASGGGGGASSIFRLRSTTESLSFSTAYGDSAIVSYSFSCLDPYDGTSTGNGTVYYYINSNMMYTSSIPQGEHSFDCGKYLKEGANTVTVTVKNSEGEEKSLTWDINCISIRLTSTFDYTLAYEGSITFKFTAYGDAAKNVHYFLDGVKDEEVTVITSSGRQYTKVFDNLKHGLHTLEVYATAKINDNEIVSNVLKYDIIVVADNFVTPIISINCDTPVLSQGELLSIPYIVYDPLSTESNVNLDIHVLGEDGNWSLYKTETRTVSRALQHWNTRYYPIGEVKFTVRLREISRSYMVHVDEFYLPVEPVTNDMELYLTSANRSNSELNPWIWEYMSDKGNLITTEFNNVNWASSGWIADANGDTSLHLTGGSTATIGYQPFSTDLRVYGKTIEFEFAVRDVNNRDANVISCKSGGIGFEITADTATLNSSLNKVDCHFDDEKKIRVSFAIEARSEYRMMSLYLDGVLTSCRQYVETDNFQQKDPVYITIGSPYCSVDLYTIRAYNTALTHTEVISNYIYDLPDVIEKSEVFERNDVYDISQNLDYAEVRKRVPVMTITGPLPQYKGDKKKPVKDEEGNVISYTNTVTYYDPFDATMCFEDAPLAQLDVQGTSSQWYVRKNYKLKFEKKFAHIKGGIPTKTYCMKADYAEATSTHNTQIANIVHTLYSDKTPAQEVDSRCRTTIQGFPCVIYHKETIDSEPYFLGKYNFNYDKGSEEAFGFTDDFEVESWEFCNNTSVACNFTGNIPAEYSMKDEEGNEVGWKEDFERRYPDHDYIDEGPEIPNEAIARFRAMHDWIVSTNDYDFTDPTPIRWDVVKDDDGNIVYETNEDGSPKLDEEDNPVPKTVGRDALYVYRDDFQKIFNLHKSLVYYVWTFFFLMVDQRAKNMFMTYWGKTGKWEPWFYDNDTCLGINNEGQMVFDYYHEDTDVTEEGNKVYNGQDSVLWNKFREAFGAEIQECYQTLRSNNKLTYELVRNQFVTKGSDMWSESIYNEDSDFKYISMLREKGDATNLSQVKGTGEHHLDYFLDGRLNYCDSKWYASAYANDFVVLRVNTPVVNNSTVAANANITITPFSNMYAGVRYRANGSLQQKRLAKNEPYTFIAPASNFNDTETAIYGASQISSLGDLSPLYCNYCDVSKATKLVELKLGTTDPLYESRLETLSVGTNRLLKKLDIRNCKSLHAPVDLSGCPSIEEIYAEGSSISGVNLSDSGYLRVIHLPASVSNLKVTNQKYIEDFSMESYENIKELYVENTPALPLTDILTSTPLLERVRLINVQWNTTESGLQETYEKLLTCGGIDETGANIAKAVVSGVVDVPSISRELLEKINTDFPELMVSVNGRILCTVSYFNYDGTLLYVTTVEQGESAIDIVAEGIIDKPVRETTDTHKYEYRGWSDSLDNIRRSRSFVAMYDVYYAVRFMDEDRTLYLEYVLEGGSIDNPILTGKIETPTKESTAQYHFTFNSWEGDYSVINDVTYIYAIFDKELRSYEISFYNETILLERKTMDYGTKITYTGSTPKKLNVTYPQDYKFLGWSPELGTVSGEESFYANFADSDHILDTWDVIAANVKNGTYKSKYPLGVRQRMFLNYADGTQEEVDMELVGYDHDVDENGSKVGLTFITKGVLKEPHIMSDSTLLNTASWRDSEMRKYLQETIYPALPDAIESYITPVVKKTSAGGGNTEAENMIETVDAIWTPSLIEMIDTYGDTKVYAAEGTTYEYFRTSDSMETTKERRIKRNASGNAQRYWLRTPVPYSRNEYWMISQLGGGISTYSSYSSRGVVFGFCIGAN